MNHCMIILYRKVTNLCVKFIHANYASQLKSHKFSIAPYIIMHKMLERINKNRINLSRGPFWWICNTYKMVTLWYHTLTSCKLGYLCTDDGPVFLTEERLSSHSEQSQLWLAGPREPMLENWPITGHDSSRVESGDRCSDNTYGNMIWVDLL